MNRLILIAVLFAVLPACTTTLYGNQTSGGGSSTTTTGSAVRGSTQVGNARLSGSFGTPPPAYASGGQVTFGNSGSAVLTAETFDDLTYTVRLAPQANGDFVLRYTVAGTPPKTRKPEPKESAEDACSKQLTRD